MARQGICRARRHGAWHLVRASLVQKSDGVDSVVNCCKMIAQSDRILVIHNWCNAMSMCIQSMPRVRSPTTNFAKLGAILASCELRNIGFYAAKL